MGPPPQRLFAVPPELECIPLRIEGPKRSVRAQDTKGKSGQNDRVVGILAGHLNRLGSQ